MKEDNSKNKNKCNRQCQARRNALASHTPLPNCLIYLTLQYCDWDKYQLFVGDVVNAQDHREYWYAAIITNIEKKYPKAVQVHYIGWNTRWDNWITLDKIKELKCVICNTIQHISEINDMEFKMQQHIREWQSRNLNSDLTDCVTAHDWYYHGTTSSSYKMLTNVNDSS